MKFNVPGLSFISLVLVVVCTSVSVSAKGQPHWTLEMNMGLFQPEDNQWETYYGSKNMPVVGGSIAYRLLSVLDVGISVDYAQDRGVGVLPLSGLQAGNVTYRVAPVALFAVLRARFSERQWLVPYAGGGYTRFAYQQSIKDQGTTRGSVNAYHARAGLQFLLDGLDQESANEMLSQYGVINSYLYVEAKRSWAEAQSYPLGGYSVKSGLMFEFR